MHQWPRAWSGPGAGLISSCFLCQVFFFFQSLAPSETGVCLLNLLINFFLFLLKTCAEQSKGHSWLSQ